ncbi:hypothetical protein AB0B48_24845 [Micromonospora sp. NPDC049089]|uniref:hypothetical protein n=1 Tax=Micromonospora sp. NPDC049089 TaxID=3155496 RepID=UPI0034047BC2
MTRSPSKSCSESGRKPKTVHSYRSVLDRLIVPHLGRTQLSMLRPIAVSKWVGKLSQTLSASQTRQASRLLAQVMASAVDNDMIASTPCRGVRLPRIPEADPRILTVEDVGRLAAHCELGDRVPVLLLAYGWRRRFVQAVAAGLDDVTPHDLRATHASWVADSHGVLVAARRLGHANASVTTRSGTEVAQG